MFEAEKDRSNNSLGLSTNEVLGQSVRNLPKPQPDFTGSSEPQEEEKIKIKNPNPGFALTL